MHISGKSGTENIHWQQRDEARGKLDSAKGDLKTLDQRIGDIERNIQNAKAQIRVVLGKQNKAENGAKLAELKGKVDAGWLKLAGNLARGLASLASKVGAGAVSITTQDVARDPTGAQTAARLRADAEDLGKVVGGYEQLIKSWTGSLDALRGQRDTLKDTIAAHASEMGRELRRAVKSDVSEKVDQGIGFVAETYANVVSSADRGLHALEKHAFSGLKKVSWAVAKFAADRELHGAYGDKAQLSKVHPNAALEASIASALTRIPVPVPVPRDELKLLTGPEPLLSLPAPSAPVGLLTYAGPKPAPTPTPKPPKPAVLPKGVDLVDVRQLYRLPEPKTGRDWAAMVFHVDYSKVGAELPGGERLRQRDIDQALDALGASKAIAYDNRSPKEVKRAITKRFGLKEEAGVNEVRVEIDRRAAAGVHPFASKKELDTKLAALGLEPSAEAIQILYAAA